MVDISVVWLTIGVLVVIIDCDRAYVAIREQLAMSKYPLFLAMIFILITLLAGCLMWPIVIYDWNRKRF